MPQLDCCPAPPVCPPPPCPPPPCPSPPAPSLSLKEFCDTCCAAAKSAKCDSAEWRLVLGGILAGALSVAAVRLWQKLSKCGDDDYESEQADYRRRSSARLRGMRGSRKAQQSKELISESQRDSGGSTKERIPQGHRLKRSINLGSLSPSPERISPDFGVDAYAGRARPPQIGRGAQPVEQRTQNIVVKENGYEAGRVPEFYEIAEKKLDSVRQPEKVSSLREERTLGSSAGGGPSSLGEPFLPPVTEPSEDQAEEPPEDRGPGEDETADAVAQDDYGDQDGDGGDGGGGEGGGGEEDGEAEAATAAEEPSDKPVECQETMNKCKHVSEFLEVPPTTKVDPCSEARAAAEHPCGYPIQPLPAPPPPSMYPCGGGAYKPWQQQQQWQQAGPVPPPPGQQPPPTPPPTPKDSGGAYGSPRSESVRSPKKTDPSELDASIGLRKSQCDGTVTVFVHSNTGRDPLLVRTSGTCPCPQCVPRPPRESKGLWESFLDTLWPIESPPDVGCAGKMGFATVALNCCQAASALNLGMSFAEIGCCYERFLLINKALDGTTVRTLKKYFTVIPLNVDECNPPEFSHASAVAFLWSLCEFRTLVYLDPSCKVVSRECEDLLDIKSLTINSVPDEKLSPAQECHIVVLQPSLTRYEAMKTALDKQAEAEGDCSKVSLCSAIKDAFGEPNYLPWQAQKIVVKETQLV